MQRVFKIKKLCECEHVEVRAMCVSACACAWGSACVRLLESQREKMIRNANGAI